jgi:hypothetical protein
VSHWISLKGRERYEAVAAVWAMVQATYAKIGLIVDQPRELYEYSNWDLFDDDGRWIAFVLSKTTHFGQKLGLAGSDGSRAGRTAVKEYVASSFFEAGHYAEVSHRMEELALEAGAPIVCAVYVRDVLNKSVEPASDGVHYRRAIKGVGEVSKVLIGLPFGIPTTSSNHPQCPIPERIAHSQRRQAAHSRQQRAVDRSNDAVFAHALSIIKL